MWANCEDCFWKADLDWHGRRVVDRLIQGYTTCSKHNTQSNLSALPNNIYKIENRSRNDETVQKSTLNDQHYGLQSKWLNAPDCLFYSIDIEYRQCRTRYSSRFLGVSSIVQRFNAFQLNCYNCWVQNSKKTLLLTRLDQRQADGFVAFLLFFRS